MTDWGSLIEESEKRPIWKGDIELEAGVHGVEGSLWWTCWDTGRMDIGTRVTLGVTRLRTMGFTGDEEADRLVEEKLLASHRTLVSGMVGSLVGPALDGARGDWSLELKQPVVEEKETRAGKPYWWVQSKVVVRCSVAKELELLINAVNRFALDMGWDGKTSFERWKGRARV